MEVPSRDSGQATASTHPTSVAVPLLLLAALFPLDLALPASIAMSATYALIPLASLRAGRSRDVWFITALAALAAGLSFSLDLRAELPVPLPHTLANRLIGLGVLLSTAALVGEQILQRARLDTTERQRAEAVEARNRESRLLELAARTARFGGWSYNRSESFARWSSEVARIHGESPDLHEVSVERAIEYYAPAFQPVIRELFQACVEKGIPFDDEFQIITRGGELRWVRGMGTPQFAADGSVSGAVGAFQDIQQQKEHEAALQQSREEFVTLASAMPLIVWTARPDGSIDFVTEALAQYSGTPSSTLLKGDNWMQVIHPDDRSAAGATWNAALLSREAATGEYRLRRHDGVYRWHIMRGVPTFDAQGYVSKWYGSALDVHQHKLLEKEQLRLAERFQQTLESITDAVLIIDRDWRFSYTNRHAERLLERDAAQLLGKVVWDEFPDAVGTPFDTHYRNAMESGQPVTFESYFEPLARWFEVRAFPFAEGLAVYFTDITERIARNRQLRLLEAAISRLNDMVIITDANPDRPEGPRIVFVNDAFEAETGYTRDEVMGRTPRMLQGPETQRAALDRLRAAIEQGHPTRVELTNVRKDGSPMELEIDLAPILEAGRVTHFVAVQREISARRRMAANLQETQHLESLAQLAGGVAHDFNNLLTIIVGNSEWMAESIAPRSELSEVAGMIVGAALRAADLTQRLLAFAQRQSLAPAPTHVGDLVRSMRESIQSAVGEDVRVHVEVEEDTPPAMVDAALLESALMNLCANARDAMPAGGQLYIAVRHLRGQNNAATGVEEQERVELTVNDTGHGVPPLVARHVFEPFYTTKPKGTASGLGLSMVHGFVTQSGGEVAFESALGQGTTVRVRLPVATGQAESNTEELAVAGDASPHGEESILLVDDDDEVRSYSSAHLRRLGYHVVEADSGAKALDLLQQAPFDLLFTDVVMGAGLNGFELADRARIRWPGLKVLFTSGYVDEARNKFGPGSLIAPLLPKPYRRAQLANFVRAVLDGHGSH